MSTSGSQIEDGRTPDFLLAMPTDAATSALPDYVFVVNPSGMQLRYYMCTLPLHSIGEKIVVTECCIFFVNVGANGRTGQQWKRMLPDLNSRLGKDCNVRTTVSDLED